MKSKNKMLWLLIIFLFVLSVSAAYGEEEYKRIGDVSVPDSMEVVKEGDVNVMVPKGGQLQQQSSFLVNENPDEYASRKFIQTEERFTRLEKKLEALQKELDDLKNILESMRQGRNDGQPQ